MHSTPRNVLFICTGNSARSILAEALLRHLGGERFIAYSAGSQPVGAVHPMALNILRELHLPIEGLRSKSWHEFTQAEAPVIDFIFTVCDSAAGETCPIWPGQPISAHWGVADPAAVTGDEHLRHRAFLETALTLKRRIELMLALPLHKLDALALTHELHSIGQS
ncbi:arsenate reductase ArsC [Leptothrix ochracea]|uniref:arsenate reductase ArsC n=1 Tax=Leptothrix ochracea TaxID=735331 RepID=UPI0034E1AF1E